MDFRFALTEMAQRVDTPHSNAPSPDAIRLAQSVLLWAEDKGYEPTDVDADDLGGVSLYFDSGGRSTWVSCLNTGKVTITVCRGNDVVASGEWNSITRHWLTGSFPDHEALDRAV